MLAYAASQLLTRKIAAQAIYGFHTTRQKIFTAILHRQPLLRRQRRHILIGVHDIFGIKRKYLFSTSLFLQCQKLHFIAGWLTCKKVTSNEYF